jgi:ribulose-phosphate 3-epimerase
MLRLGVDIGGTNVIAGLLDESGNVLAKCKHRTENPKEETVFVHFIKQIVLELLQSCGRSLDEVGFCGVGIPGTVSTDGKIAIKVPNLGWNGFPLAEQLQKVLNMPVRLIQDSRAAAYGEYMAGGGAGYKAVVCITLGTGIGTGMVIDGRVYDGALGCAGELGHVPVAPGGRECGCGQRGCLECYSAGKGLNITARELFGSDCDSEKLFEMARSGDGRARAAVSDAVEKLGAVIISMTNLLSPDCILFSGGLSFQQELYVKPLVELIQAKRYRSGVNDELHIGTALLGEDAPMIGAALLPHEASRRGPKLSASIMCADWLHLEDELKRIEEAGIGYLHCDIMDGHFVPNMMLPPELLKKIRKGTSLPYDIHIMAENPERIIPQLPLREGDIVAVHYESTVHVQRALALVRSLGATPAIALNPATPVEMIQDILPDIGMVLIMTVNPGFAGQKLVPQCIDKIQRTRQMLDRAGYSQIMIEVDGNCSFETVPKMYSAGAELFVAGSSSVFSPDMSIGQATRKLMETIK